MKIAITSTGKSLDSDVDQRFGRCKYFILIDTDSMEYNVLSNESIMESGGAGIKAAQTIANTDSKVIVTGNVGPNAFQTLSSAGIKIYTGATGTVNECIEKYKNGQLKETKSANVESHSGMR